MKPNLVARLVPWAVALGWVAVLTLMVANVVLAESRLDFWIKLVGELFLLWLLLKIHLMHARDRRAEEEDSRLREAKFAKIRGRRA